MLQTSHTPHHQLTGSSQQAQVEHWFCPLSTLAPQCLRMRDNSEVMKDCIINE